LRIYGGYRALQRVQDLMKVVLRGDGIDIRIDYVTIRPGLIWEDESIIISAFPVTHRGSGCFGFLFEERSRRPFLPDEAERLQVPHGPERRLLVRGHSITVADGRVIRPDQVLGPEIKGTKFVHVGDAGRTDDLVEVCRGADALVIEATYASQEAEMAARFGHLTATQAAELAANAHVGHLFLVHLSRRYRARDIAREARAIFPNTTVPRDLDRYRVTKGVIERIRPENGR